MNTANFSTNTSVNTPISGLGAGDTLNKVEIVWMMLGTDYYAANDLLDASNLAGSAAFAIANGRSTTLTAGVNDAAIAAFQTTAGTTVTIATPLDGDTYTPAVRVTENKAGGGTQSGPWTKGPAVTYSTGTTSTTAAATTTTAAATTTTTAAATTTTTTTTTAAATTTTTTAAPTTVLDNFTGTDGTTVASHTPDTGGAWSLFTAYASNTASLLGNKVQVDNSTGLGVAYVNATTLSANATVTATVVVLDNQSQMAVGVFGRLDPVASSYYEFEYHQGLGGWLLAKKTAGNAAVQIGSTAAATLSAGTYTLELVMTGSTIVGKVNGVAVVTVTDSDLSAAGKSGFVLSRGTSGTGHGIVLDSFSAA